MSDSVNDMYFIVLLIRQTGNMEEERGYGMQIPSWRIFY